ncbi:hypothetical protein JL722_11552 [Aureococcus anophagefferens]|nr:hypothetical protein JL722_11552 [Aureococcus anophagefferens]
MEESASSSDAASAAPDAAPDAPMEDAAPAAPAAAEPEPEWKTSGPFVGQWITRSVLNEASKVASFSVGKVVGYLSAAESDYVDEKGAAAALWHVAYVSGELVTDEGLKKGVADAPAPAAAAEESEYEKHRRERIEANQAFLQSLGFTGGDVGLPKEEEEARPRKKAEPSAPAAVRAPREAGQYNENRAYKEAMAEKAADDAAEKARRLQRRLDKRQKKKRSVDELEKQRSVDLLARAARRRKRLLKHAAADAKAARALPRPCWLDARGPVDPSTAEGIDRDWCRTVASRNRWCPQVGDVVVYFADGHAEALEARRGRADFGDVEELWFEKRRPSWFLEPARRARVVKKPMDLGTVSDLVLQGAYDNDGCGGDRSFDDDLRLPFSTRSSQRGRQRRRGRRRRRRGAGAEDRKDLKVEVVLRLVPLYMAADARGGPDFAGGGEACRAALGAIDWHVWHSGFVVDPFNPAGLPGLPARETVVEVLDDDGDGRKMVLRGVRPLSVADVHGGLIAQPAAAPKKGKPPTQPIAVTLKVAGTKLWCLKDAKDLAKVLNAFNG